MASVAQLPPRGRYLADEAGLLAGVSGHTIGQWARRGYIRSSVSTGRPRVYSFQDLAEAIVVHELLERGVAHADVLRAVRALRDTYGDWPLTHAPLATVTSARRSQVYLREGEQTYDVGGRQPWQQVLDPQNLEELRRLLRTGGWAARNLVPQLQHIEVDPDRLSGRPTIRGRRIAAEDVAEMAATMDMDDLLDDYDLTVAEVKDARRWWREARRLAAA